MAHIELLESYWCYSLCVLTLTESFFNKESSSSSGDWNRWSGSDQVWCKVGYFIYCLQSFPLLKQRYSASAFNQIKDLCWYTICVCICSELWLKHACRQHNSKAGRRCLYESDRASLRYVQFYSSLPSLVDVKYSWTLFLQNSRIQPSLLWDKY